jgi:hypothetical protein
VDGQCLKVIFPQKKVKLCFIHRQALTLSDSRDMTQNERAIQAEMKLGILFLVYHRITIRIVCRLDILALLVARMACVPTVMMGHFVVDIEKGRSIMSTFAMRKDCRVVWSSGGRDSADGAVWKAWSSCFMPEDIPRRSDHEKRNRTQIPTKNRMLREPATLVLSFLYMTLLCTL